MTEKEKLMDTLFNDPDKELVNFSFTAGPALTTVLDHAIAGAARALCSEMEGGRGSSDPQAPAASVDPLQGAGTTNVDPQLHMHQLRLGLEGDD